MRAHIISMMGPFKCNNSRRWIRIRLEYLISQKEDKTIQQTHPNSPSLYK